MKLVSINPLKNNLFTNYYELAVMWSIFYPTLRLFPSLIKEPDSNYGNRLYPGRSIKLSLIDLVYK